MTDISKEAVDALLQGVTVGPWMVAGVRGKVEGQSVHNVFRYNAGEKRDEQICAVWYDTKTGLGAKDARFIAAARELVPALRAALDEAEARAVKAEAERDALRAAKWDVKHTDTMNDMVQMGMARDEAEARANDYYERWNDCQDKRMAAEAERDAAKAAAQADYAARILAALTPTAPDLSDPVTVHANMLRGTIAKPTVEQIIHLYGVDALAKALAPVIVREAGHEPAPDAPDPAAIREAALLNENGDLIGHPLEMQLRAEWRKVAKHHGLPNDGVVEADIVRAILSLIAKGAAE